MASAAHASSVFHAVSCSTRREILDALSSGERNVGELVAAASVTQSAVSQQLAVLRSAGLVEERAEGRFRVYRLLPGPLAALDRWLARYRSVMEQRLDALGAVLDQMPDAPSRRTTKKPRARRAKRSSRA